MTIATLLVTWLPVHVIVPPIWPRIFNEITVEGSDCMRRSAEIDWEAVPNRCGRNEQRARVIPNAARPAERRRILLIGDSLSRYRGYVERWQELLDQETAQPGWEVWNAAVSGYNPYQELWTLRLLLDQVQPELVALQLCPNDLQSGYEVVEVDDRLRRLFLNPDGSHRLLLRLTFFSRALDYFLYWRYGEPMPVMVRTQHADTEQTLAAFRDDVAKAGLPFVIVLFPYFGEDPDSPISRDYQGLKAMVQRLGAMHLLAESALPPPLSQYRGRYGDEIHPSQIAHRLVAARLMGFVRDAGLLNQPRRDRSADAAPR